MNSGAGTLLKWAAVGVGGWLAYRAIRNLRAYDFAGRVVLVSGASRGLGLVLARQLVDTGAKVSICARDPDELERARRELEARGGQVHAYPCDLTDELQARAWVAAATDRFGPADVLINNAGIISVGPEEEMTMEDYQQAMDLHYWAAVNTTRAVLPEMRRRREGRVVNITSIGGKVALPHLLPYVGSKFALVGFSEGLRAELAKDGITVTTVVPGLMRTGSPRNATFKGRNKEEYAWFSISDSLPILSMNAERAASHILAACARGDAEIILTLPAKLAVWFHGLFPGLTADILSLVNRLLPSPGGVGTASMRGSQSESEWSPSALTTLTEEAALENNEVPGPGRGLS